jgi:hypothetical protein
VHKVFIYTEYHSVCPLVGIGTLPPPLSPASVPLPRYHEGGTYSPAGEGLGESQFRRLEKKLSSLPTLWVVVKQWKQVIINSPACVPLRLTCLHVHPASSPHAMHFCSGISFSGSCPCLHFLCECKCHLIFAMLDLRISIFCLPQYSEKSGRRGCTQIAFFVCGVQP